MNGFRCPQSVRITDYTPPRHDTMTATDGDDGKTLQQQQMDQERRRRKQTMAKTGRTMAGDKSDKRTAVMPVDPGRGAASPHHPCIQIHIGFFLCF